MLPLAQVVRLVALTLATALALPGNWHDGADVGRDRPGRQRIGPTMIVWGSGLAAGLVETITPSTLGNHKIWRITHYSQDPTTTSVTMNLHQRQHARRLGSKFWKCGA